ncbi:response regulator [Chryseobacterium formosus]|uniref:Response regulator n=1 Tax=Chryseobacterium formosus TaxID=1537363 RepID=A0ABT3XV46_9FLAO|nr:response regulator [Chryseobacterium formosus]MCX8525545.1 response regulator [Chryseobacterium formosus]
MNNQKIMICDDDAGILEVLEMMLEMEGFSVFTENNSTNLLKEVANVRPDLLLMDLWMPVLSGDQLLKTIRITPEFQKLPVIIFSVSVDGKHIAKDAGADDFIAKPFDMDNVANTIRKVLTQYQM